MRTSAEPSYSQVLFVHRRRHIRIETIRGSKVELYHLCSDWPLSWGVQLMRVKLEVAICTLDEPRAGAGLKHLG